LYSEAGPGENMRLPKKKKITNAKKGWGHGSNVENLPNKHEALSSNSNTVPPPKYTYIYIYSGKIRVRKMK
jgi:hypothetical protein